MKKEQEIKTHEDLVLGATYESHGDILKYAGIVMEEDEEFLSFERLRGNSFMEKEGKIYFFKNSVLLNIIKRIYEN